MPTHLELGLPAALPGRSRCTVRAAGEQAEAAAVRLGCFGPALLIQGWGVWVLQSGRSPTSTPDSIPYLSRGCRGAGYGENWSVSTGEKGGGSEAGLPKAPSISRAQCSPRPAAILPQQAPSHVAAG